jgi:DNA-directed RNA polymerase subunit RPC12/RpoP
MNKLKEISLHRYVCDNCGEEFKIEYENSLKNIGFCPFCGTKRDDEIGNIIYDGEFNGEIKYLDTIGKPTNPKEIVFKEKLFETILKNIKVSLKNCMESDFERFLIQRNEIVYSTLVAEFENYENIFSDETKEKIEQSIVDKLNFILHDGKIQWK